MFTEQPSYSTTILRRPPARELFFHVEVENEWDFIAEAVVGSNSQPNTQLNQLILLLESHGIVVHRLPALPAESPSVMHIRSPFVTAPLEDQQQTPSTAAAKDSFFPRDVALVHGTRIIEAPPLSHAEASQGLETYNSQNVKALFDQLENAGVTVTRWPSDSFSGGERNKIPEEKLVDIEGSQRGSDKEDEDPRFCPSDILILSPKLLITRLSSFTNSKGLEYLWSVLSRPETVIQDDGRDTSGLPSMLRVDSSRPAHMTTLLVRITGPDAPAASSPAPAASVLSPRSPRFTSGGTKSAASAYAPLCRALVPINGNVMLYDPALIAEDEARRLKSVLDRVQEISPGLEGSSATESDGIFTGRHTKHDSGMSYGTFGSLDQIDSNGWQFISVNELHLTSILMVYPQLALLSLASYSSSLDPSAMKYSGQRALTNVSQALESLGVRAVRLPPADLSYWQPDGGVRDAVMVLRRESNLVATDDENDQNHRDAQQQDDGGMEEGCMQGICASLSAWLCESLTSSGASEADAVSDRLQHE